MGAGGGPHDACRDQDGIIAEHFVLCVCDLAVCKSLESGGFDECDRPGRPHGPRLLWCENFPRISVMLGVAPKGFATTGYRFLTGAARRVGKIHTNTVGTTP